MSVQNTIEQILRAELSPQVLEIENESHRHSGPATESHFKITAVAAAFNDVPRVKRHQQVYGLLSEQLRSGVHALALHLHSPTEWEADSSIPDSPNCRGGSR